MKRRSREWVRDFALPTLLRLFLTLGVTTNVSGHGCPRNITLGGETYQGVEGEMCGTVPQNSIIRPPGVGNFLFNGVAHMGENTLACGQATNTPAGKTGKIEAGEDVTYTYSNWAPTNGLTLNHYGSLMTYLANCNGNCNTFDPNKGDVWFKIAGKGYENGKWAAFAMAEAGNKWTVTIPPGIAPGQYLMRHEILVLQNSRGSTFQTQSFLSCAQIEITGAGKCAPGKEYLVAFPGAYGDDVKGPEGIVWAGGTDGTRYVMPGPKVWNVGASCEAVVVPPPPPGGASSSASTPGPSGFANSVTNINVDDHETKVNKFPVAPVAAGVGGGCFLLLLCCLIFCCRKSRSETDSQRENLKKIIAARFIRDKKEDAKAAKTDSICSSDRKHGSAPPAYTPGAASIYGDEKAGAVVPPIWPAPAASEYAGSEAGIYGPSPHIGAPGSMYDGTLAGANPFETAPYASSHYAGSAAGAEPYGGYAAYPSSAYAASSVAGSMDGGKGYSGRSEYASSEAQKSYGGTKRSKSAPGRSRSTRSGNDAVDTITPSRYRRDQDGSLYAGTETGGYGRSRDRGGEGSTYAGSEAGETLFGRSRAPTSAYAGSDAGADGSRRSEPSTCAGSEASQTVNGRGRSGSRGPASAYTGSDAGGSFTGSNPFATGQSVFAGSEAAGSYRAGSNAGESRRTGSRRTGRGNTTPRRGEIVAASRFAGSEAAGSYWA